MYFKQQLRQSLMIIFKRVMCVVLGVIDNQPILSFQYEDVLKWLQVHWKKEYKKYNVFLLKKSPLCSYWSKSHNCCRGCQIKTFSIFYMLWVYKGKCWAKSASQYLCWVNKEKTKATQFKIFSSLSSLDSLPTVLCCMSRSIRAEQVLPCAFGISVADFTASQKYSKEQRPLTLHHCCSSMNVLETLYILHAL